MSVFEILDLVSRILIVVSIILISMNQNRFSTMIKDIFDLFRMQQDLINELRKEIIELEKNEKTIKTTQREKKKKD